ncbi:MAG: hypothetical protein IT463_02600, partial [Planctomycetes bacterium]|nr:hypothetical protein [Planctomycetota bacterium]
VRLSSVPSAEPGEAGPGVVRMNCFGDVRLELTENGDRASLLLQRRAHMTMDRAGQPLDLTCDQLALRGRVLRNNGGVMLGEQELDADGNVALSARNLKGYGGQLAFRQQEKAHEITLRDGASLELDQSSKSRPATLRLLADQSIRAKAPVMPAGQGVQEVDVEVLGSARVWREAHGAEEWRVVGRRVAVRSVRDAPRAEDFSHAFEVEAEGYSPLLQVTAAAAPASLQGAAVHGRSASGTFAGGRLKARALGPGLLAVVDSTYALAPRLREALSPRRERSDGDAKIATGTSRLALRASRTLDIDVLAESQHPRPETAHELALAADGDVSAEHEPVPRNDTELVVVSGESLALALRQQPAAGMHELRLLDIRPGVEGARLTVGYDLLAARGVHIEGAQRNYQGSIEGPGRLTARDKQTLDGLRQAVRRLPRPRDQAGEQPAPDAAWLTFSTGMKLDSDDDRHAIDARDCVLRMVRGDFETPRAGLAGFEDLPELEEAEVARLYEAAGGSLQLVSTGHAAGPGAVVHVLRLAGSARLRSVADGFSAAARDAVEVSGADRQRNPDAPLSVVLLGEAEVELAEAGPYFGNAVRGGTFGYDGRWKLTARERLEFTVTPLPEDTPGAVTKARGLADNAQKADMPAWAAAVHATRGAEACRAVTRPVDEVRQAAQELAAAAHHLRVAAALGAVGDSMAGHWRERGQQAARRAGALLGGRMEVVARGGVKARLQALKDAVPAIEFSAQSLSVVFNGLGAVVDAAAAGPVEVARAGYSLRGSVIRRAADGTLTLDGAGITLPADTGVEVTGVKQISLKQTEASPEAGTGLPGRTMVTRVTGKKLGVRVRVTHGTGR